MYGMMFNDTFVWNTSLGEVQPVAESHCNINVYVYIYI